MIDVHTAPYEDLLSHVNRRLDAAEWTQLRAAEAIGKGSPSGYGYVRAVLSDSAGKRSRPVLTRILDALDADEERFTRGAAIH